MRNFAFVVATALALLSCSHPTPPVGRWEGVYQSDDAMIAARLEVESDGQVRVSAPDLLDIGTASAEDRDAMRQKLAADLAAAWEEVVPRQMDFDGATFRKPGGVAPQIVWDAKTKRMLLMVYVGTRPAIRIAMRSVGEFSDNPWPS